MPDSEKRKEEFMMSGIELLAPAGSVETMYAGINAGADAIYMGGQLFGARAYADNPDNSMLLNAIDYIHINNKKIYLTVNTLLKDKEIEKQLYDYLLPLYEHGLDAVIVQDIGVFMYIKNNFPDMDIHISTQMSACGINGAKLLKEMGASRIVTARELSLKELKDIHDSVDIEIESFIHGAMCYSYSGMCLFSSIAGGRSGNRGRCAGPCRQPYELYEEGRRINDKNSLYALSLKDMNTLTILPEIISSGVYSLKIEGRMKSPEYVAGVVSVYRKYIDLYFEKGMDKYSVSNEDMDNLAGLYSRSGSCTGYYKGHNSKSMVSFAKPSYKTENNIFADYVSEKYCRERKQKEVLTKVTLRQNEPAILEISDDDISISVTGEIVETATNRPLLEENIYKQINKTNTSLLKFHRIFIDIDDNIFMLVKQLNELRRHAIEEFTEVYLSKYRRTLSHDIKDYDYSYGKNIINENIIDENLTDSVNLICMVSTPEQSECVIKHKVIKDIYVSTDYMNAEKCADVVMKIFNSRRNCYIVMPAVFREKAIKYMENLLAILSDNNITEDSIGFVIRNIDELGYVLSNNINNFIIDNSLYTFNRYSYNFFKEKNAKRVTISYELNYKELIRQNYGDCELIVYGKIPLMISSECVNMNYNLCDKVQKKIDLKDRLGYNFTAYNCCEYCYNIIYNNIPLSLLGVYNKLHKTKINNYRLNFTLEDEKTTKRILKKFIKAFYYNDNINNSNTDNINADNNITEDFEFTRGHFNRGVE